MPGYQAYREAQILSASPVELRLLLIEGALRWARSCQSFQLEGDGNQASLAAEKCHAILTELGGCVQRDQSEAAETVYQIYLYLSKTLGRFRLTRDVNLLLDVVRVLESERENWAQIQQALGPEVQLSPDDSETAGDHRAGGTGLSLEA